MASSSRPSEILFFDLSNEDLKPGTSTWVAACKDIRRAFEECGCFVAVYDKVPLQFNNDVYASVDELFNLPPEIKTQNTSNKPYHEYFGQYTTMPLYESIAIEEPSLEYGSKNFTDLMWPAGNDRFRTSIHSFSKLLVELDQLVMRMILESYGIEKYYDSHVDSSEYLLRFFKYRVPDMNETDVGIPAHTDKNMVSIIHQNHVDGLQIKTKDGKWVDLELSPTTFVFMAAEVILAWSNDRIKPCEHQVIMKSRETRYSIGLFSFNRGITSVPEELVDDLHPLRFKPFDMYDYLRFHKSDEGKKVNGSIKAFCGV